jgi:hypothetical protein
MASPSERSDVTQPAQSKPTLHWRKVHKRLNEHLLFAEDIGPVGTKVDVEIVDSGVEKVKGEDGAKDMPWIAFAGKKKRLALNVGNSKALETLTDTPDVFSWRGPITLVVVRTKYFDQKTREMQETDAIRIAPRRPVSNQSSQGVTDGNG